jgi:hypothetical protein
MIVPSFPIQEKLSDVFDFNMSGRIKFYLYGSGSIGFRLESLMGMKRLHFDVNSNYLTNLFSR